MKYIFEIDKNIWMNLFVCIIKSKLQLSHCDKKINIRVISDPSLLLPL